MSMSPSPSEASNHLAGGAAAGETGAACSANQQQHQDDQGNEEDNDEQALQPRVYVPGFPTDVSMLPLDEFYRLWRDWFLCNHWNYEFQPVIVEKEARISLWSLMSVSSATGVHQLLQQDEQEELAHQSGLANYMQGGSFAGGGGPMALTSAAAAAGHYEGGSNFLRDSQGGALMNRAQRRGTSLSSLGLGGLHSNTYGQHHLQPCHGAQAMDGINHGIHEENGGLLLGGSAGGGLGSARGSRGNIDDINGDVHPLYASGVEHHSNWLYNSASSGTYGGGPGGGNMMSRGPGSGMYGNIPQYSQASSCATRNSMLISSMNYSGVMRSSMQNLVSPPSQTTAGRASTMLFTRAASTGGVTNYPTLLQSSVLGSAGGGPNISSTPHLQQNHLQLHQPPRGSVFLGGSSSVSATIVSPPAKRSFVTAYSTAPFSTSPLKRMTRGSVFRGNVDVPGENGTPLRSSTRTTTLPAGGLVTNPEGARNSEVGARPSMANLFHKEYEQVEVHQPRPCLKPDQSEEYQLHDPRGRSLSPSPIKGSLDRQRSAARDMYADKVTFLSRISQLLQSGPAQEILVEDPTIGGPQEQHFQEYGASSRPPGAGPGGTLMGPLQHRERMPSHAEVDSPFTSPGGGPHQGEDDQPEEVDTAGRESQQVGVEQRTSRGGGFFSGLGLPIPVGFMRSSRRSANPDKTKGTSHLLPLPGVTAVPSNTSADSDVMAVQKAFLSYSPRMQDAVTFMGRGVRTLVLQMQDLKGTIVSHMSSSTQNGGLLGGGGGTIFPTGTEDPPDEDVDGVGSPRGRRTRGTSTTRTGDHVVPQSRSLHGTDIFGKSGGAAAHHEGAGGNKSNVDLQNAVDSANPYNRWAGSSHGNTRNFLSSGGRQDESWFRCAVLRCLRGCRAIAKGGAESLPLSPRHLRSGKGTTSSARMSEVGVGGHGNSTSSTSSRGSSALFTWSHLFFRCLHFPRNVSHRSQRGKHERTIRNIWSIRR
ncbi:unnamed protein product [Amoebophrya sp. A25]|nr:unnamed protein product [Amoebophrya sp. A25]|eukprot:GSA25T00005009001.1